jgi:riboflavin kinase / FMN adenylyltransferase
VWITRSLTNVLTPTVVALGNFDGIHQGHRQVILPTIKSDAWQFPEGVRSTVVTFYPHPKVVLTKQPLSLLTPLDEKVAQLKAIALEQLVLLPFNNELACLSPEEFVEIVLIKHLQAKCVSVGADFCFGRQRSGNAEDLCRLADKFGVEVSIAPLKVLEGDRISSSAIRYALQTGDIQRANYLLGRPYTLVGEVVQGQQLGRTIGFPTANLHLPKEKFLPHYGVYAVQAQVCFAADQLPALDAPCINGVMNLGMRPTVDGDRLSAEVHLFNWAEDLYGKVLSVSLCAFLRPEQKFASLDALKLQIARDCEQAKQLLDTTP